MKERINAVYSTGGSDFETRQKMETNRLIAAKGKEEPVSHSSNKSSNFFL
jgi:hypothetical protein